MNRHRFYIAIVTTAFLSLAFINRSSTVGQVETASRQGSEQWSLGYWTPWGSPPLPPKKIRWSGLTHVVHAWALVESDGNLDLRTQRVAEDAPALIAAARSHGVKALLGIGQAYWLGRVNNLPEATARKRPVLVENIVRVVNQYGFDGVDIDWEPLQEKAHCDRLRALAADLRSRLGTKSLSAAAIITDSACWGEIERDFDRIGIMTYDLSGTWSPASWHNSALFASGDPTAWSVDLAVKRFIAAGVPARKVSIGIPFFGYEWAGEGISGPGKPWKRMPRLKQLAYQRVAGRIKAEDYRWDSDARVPYLSREAPRPDEAWFLSYDNERSVDEKIRYVKGRRLGGWIVWELSGDYLPAQDPDQPLLKAIENAK